MLKPDDGIELCEKETRRAFGPRMKGGPKSIQKYRLTIERIKDDG
jgi:hypothetical protein